MPILTARNGAHSGRGLGGSVLKVHGQKNKPLTPEVAGKLIEGERRFLEMLAHDARNQPEDVQPAQGHRDHRTSLAATSERGERAPGATTKLKQRMPPTQVPKDRNSR